MYGGVRVGPVRPPPSGWHPPAYTDPFYSELADYSFQYGVTEASTGAQFGDLESRVGALTTRACWTAACRPSPTPWPGLRATGPRSPTQDSQRGILPPTLSSPLTPIYLFNHIVLNHALISQHSFKIRSK